MHAPRTSRLLLVATLFASLGLASAASAQFGNRSRDDDFARAEDSGRLEPGGGYRTGNRHLPGTRDPFDRSGWLEVGFHHDRDTTGSVKQRFSYVPMRLGVDLPVADHVQFRFRAGMTGLIDSVSGAGPLDERNRTFRPANVEAGAFYAVGGGETGDDFRWTLYAGGSAVLPTAQLPTNESLGTALRTLESYGGALAVHGIQGGWLFSPESWGLVPGVTGRIVWGPLFVNASLDVAFLVSTDKNVDATHLAQIRAEAGYRVADSFRAGVGITDVIGFGPGASGAGDHAQAAIRVFLRADFAAFTFGEELVINRGAPFGNAFDGNGPGVWGLVSTLGIAL